MSYATTLERLFQSNQRGVKLGLDTMHSILAKLGHPEKKFRAIHIAGTNGKGSVSTKIAKALELAGYKTGLYTSPHISSYRERIQINGSIISEEDISALLERIPKDAAPTFFEITTLLSFLYFAENNVDYAVLETGLGGRLDATNVVTPVLSIITSIALDHTEILGNTLDAIAFEKAGIIKPSTPLILGPRAQLQPILETAVNLSCPLIQVQGTFDTFDAENNASAKAALTELGIPPSHIEEACKIRPPCRVQEVLSPFFSFPVILDVAHNPDGLTALIRSLKTLYPHQNFKAAIAFSSSKDIPECLKILTGFFSHLYLIPSSHHRIEPASTLARHLEAIGCTSYTLSDSMEEALKSNQGPLVITGSFFIMDDARQALNLSFPRDPIAEVIMLKTDKCQF